MMNNYMQGCEFISENVCENLFPFFNVWQT